jgi:hypothetical protein
MTEQTLSLLEGLEKQVGALAQAGGATEVFGRLLEAGRLHAPRVALLLLREGRFKGWGCLGYSAEATARFSTAVFPAGSGWLGRLASDETISSAALPAGETGAVFGQAPASETLGFPLRLGGSPAAILIVERNGPEEPWEPGAVSLLTTVARLRLELDLTWRRHRAAASGKDDKASRAAAAPAAPKTSPAPAEPVPEAVALAPAEPVDEAKARVLDEARRYAKLVATDVRLYNEEAVLAGRRDGDLANRLWVHLQRGREAFLRRFPDLGDDGLAMLHDACVDVLAGGDASAFRVSKDLSKRT